jgi:hypothetical protein
MAIDKTKIEKQAKEILDKFAKALEKVELVSPSKDKETIFVDRDEFEREENSISSEAKTSENFKDAAKADNNFKKRILDNALDKDDDFIIAEKGSWK